jgi:CRP/FNR family transcriptional regulator
MPYRESRAEFLDAFPLFRDGSPRLVDELGTLLRPLRFSAGAAIYREQDACAGISFLLGGEIRVYKVGPGVREVTLYVIGRGESCILNAACILSGFHRLVDRHPEMRGYVLHALSDRLFGIMSLVEEVLFNRLDERLVTYLKDRARDGEIAATHQEIANDLGTSREVVSRLLGDLAAKGRIDPGRGRITVTPYL